jgi:hypothetical protein
VVAFYFSRVLDIEREQGWVLGSDACENPGRLHPLLFATT